MPTTDPTKAPDLSTLFGDAASEGTISDEVAAKAARHVTNLGQRFNAAMGVAARTVKAREPYAIHFRVDNTLSITEIPQGPQLVCDGVNMVPTNIRNRKAGQSSIMSVSWFNGTALPYTLIDDFPMLVQGVAKAGPNQLLYKPDFGRTPLYDNMFDGCVLSIGKVQEFINLNKTARATTVFVSDGANNVTPEHSIKDLLEMITGMRASEQHLIIGVGIDDGYTDFRKLFREVGIEEKWILTPGANSDEIAAAFGAVSQVSGAMSQQGATPSQMAGF